MYNACMPNVQVRDVPEEIHKALLKRAERGGQSLQQFLAAQLEQIALTPALDDILDRVEHRPKGHLSAADTTTAVEAERARR